MEECGCPTPMHMSEKYQEPMDVGVLYWTERD